MELECNEAVKRLGKWSIGSKPLYQLLSDGLKKAILDGEIPLSARLPPERSFAAALAVSRSTVVSAYELLREEGWLESRQGSGTRVLMPPVSRAASLDTIYNRIPTGSPVMEQLFGQHDNMIDFTTGIPAGLNLHRFGDPQIDLTEIVQHGRLLPQGSLALRRSLAQKFTAEGVPTTEDQLLITNGAQQAISLLSALYLQPGDTVMLENPTYFGALDAFRQAGARLVGITVDPATGIRLDLLQNVLSSMHPRFIYLTPTFQNPTGAVMPAENRKKLAQLAEKDDLVIIEDNTLGELALDVETPPHLATFGRGDNIISIGSMSKLFWTGLRIGWVRAAPAVITRLTRLKVVDDLGSGLVSQFIAVRWLEQIQQAKEWRRQELGPRLDRTIRLLQEHLPEWEYNRPGGGLFLWVKMGGSNAASFAQLALRYGVIILPGNMMSADESYGQYTRLPFLQDPATIEEGILRLSRAWQTQGLLNRPNQPALNFIV